MWLDVARAGERAKCLHQRLQCVASLVAKAARDASQMAASVEAWTGPAGVRCAAAYRAARTRSAVSTHASSAPDVSVRSLLVRWRCKSKLRSRADTSSSLRAPMSSAPLAMCSGASLSFASAMQVCRAASAPARQLRHAAGRGARAARLRYGLAVPLRPSWLHTCRRGAGVPGQPLPAVLARSSRPSGGAPAPCRARVAAWPPWKRRRCRGLRSWASSSCGKQLPPTLTRWCRARTDRAPAARLRCF